MRSLANLVVQIVLVVAAVLVFSFFDPFGLLVPKKQTLQDTPISVVSIKEIGQLITAEYYGEVLSSLHEQMIEEVDQKDFGNKVDTLNQKYIQALKRFYEIKDSVKIRWYRRKRDILDQFYASTAITKHPFYQDMIKEVLVKTRYSNEREIVNVIFKMDVKDTSKIKAQFKIDKQRVADAKIKELEKLKNTKAYRKKQIIAIGRGWVKAGIDFGSFTEHNFKYDKANRTIYLFGLEPTILNADINPWFNAKQKIKGFEIIAATNRANDSSYLRKVKQSCLEKLRAQAYKAGINMQAKINAEETLKNFFALLLNEPLDKVVIMKNSLAEYQALLESNGIFPKEKLSLIDSTLLALYKIDSVAAGHAVTKLLHSKTIIGNDTCSINRYTALTHQIVEDNLIEPDEWKTLQKEFKDVTCKRLDSVWYMPLPAKTKLVECARLWAANNPIYNAEGIGYWYDSVTNKPAYQRYQTALDSMSRALFQHKYKTSRAQALNETLQLLIKNCRTVIIEKTEESDATKIKQLLNSLTNQSPHKATVVSPVSCKD